MITGFDLVFLSDGDPLEIERLFFLQLHQLWEAPWVDDSERSATHFEFFIAKNAAMDAFHEAHGFALNEDGEGCLMFCGRKFDAFHTAAQIREAKLPRRLRNVEPYPITIFLREVWEYTLVLPGDPGEDAFCRRIVRMLEAAILKAARV